MSALTRTAHRIREVYQGDATGRSVSEYPNASTSVTRCCSRGQATAEAPETKPDARQQLLGFSRTGGSATEQRTPPVPRPMP